MRSARAVDSAEIAAILWTGFSGLYMMAGLLCDHRSDLPKPSTVLRSILHHPEIL
jgi:hypothetical protein